MAVRPPTTVAGKSAEPNARKRGERADRPRLHLHSRTSHHHQGVVHRTTPFGFPKLMARGSGRESRRGGHPAADICAATQSGCREPDVAWPFPYRLPPLSALGKWDGWTGQSLRRPRCRGDGKSAFVLGSDGCRCYSLNTGLAAKALVHPLGGDIPPATDLRREHPPQVSGGNALCENSASSSTSQATSVRSRSTLPTTS